MEEFQVVTRKNKKNWKKSKNLKKNEIPLLDGDTSPVIDVDKCIGRIEDIKSSMETCDFWRTIKEEIIEEALFKSLDVKEIVLYGIGSIANSKIAQHQLSLVLLITQYLKIKVMYYDPVLNDQEHLVLNGFNFVRILYNEECKRSVSIPTLFVMFHCGKAMYNNLLWANWKQLSNLVVIGNAFSSYVDRIPSSQLKQTAPYIEKVIPFTKETSITNSYHFNDVFNDTAIHVFPDDLLRKADSSFWENVKEPESNHEDVEIISKKEEGFTE
ncbi:SRR1-like protein [Clytia hemisphaerica]|uniref:SRR1-like domain-containing protein n=1 Tax=Clytia hemisphaerica TaxID=252671 RepID=A0A7M5TV89_9CNID|eukprot:TCONS_00023398-protein